MDSTAVQNCYLFKGASVKDAEAIAQLAQRHEALAGEDIFLSGQEADGFFIIQSGTVQVFMRGKDLPIATMSSKQSFGELPFFHHATRDTTARASELSHLMRIPFAALQKLLDARPQLALLVYRNASARYAYMLTQLAAEFDRPYI